MAIPEATKNRVRMLLKDDSSTQALLSDAELEAAINAAITTYSQDSPRVVSQSFSGNNTAYSFPLIAPWTPGISVIREIEYPAGGQYRTLVDPSYWEITESTGTLRFMSLVPATGMNNIVVYHTAPHSHSAASDTIPTWGFDALCWLAASYAALMLAAKMAKSSEPAMGVGVANFRDGETRWRSISKEYRMLYEQRLGIGGGSAQVTGGAGEFMHWSTRMSSGSPWWSRSRLFH